MTDLKPCPFCGKNAIITYWGKLLDNLKTDEKEDCYSVSCVGCDASISGTSETEVVNRWNNRVNNTEKICANCKHWVLIPGEDHIGECIAYTTWNSENMGECPCDMTDPTPCDGDSCSYWEVKE